MGDLAGGPHVGLDDRIRGLLIGRHSPWSRSALPIGHKTPAGHVMTTITQCPARPPIGRGSPAASRGLGQRGPRHRARPVCRGTAAVRNAAGPATREAALDAGVVSVAAFMLMLDITVVNVALPDIRRGLGASFSDLQWVLDAYALTLAIFLLTAGSLGDVFGRRRCSSPGSPPLPSPRWPPDLRRPRLS